MRAALRWLPWLPSLLVLLSPAAPRRPSDPDELADFKQTNDPLEPTNRVFYAINNGLDTAILKPASQAYVFVLPEAGAHRHPQHPG